MNAPKTILFAVLAAGLVAGTALGWWLHTTDSIATDTQAAPATGERRILYYRSPMDPKLTSKTPVKDSMGMDYLPVYAGEEQQNEGGITIDPRLAQNLGVRTGVAERRTFARAIRTVGTVAVDERGVSLFSPKVSGWVERLYVRAVGDVVERGAPLADIYSPELLSAQEEYRIALTAAQQLKHAGNGGAHHEAGALAEAARERLKLLDLPEPDIVALERGAAPKRTVTLRAPYRGIVTALDVRAGASVTPEMRLFSLADLSQVWVNVEVYAAQLPWVKAGDPVELTVAFLPGRRWQGRIDYLYPTLNTESRTVTARVVFDNPDGVLRPGMYANAVIGGNTQTAALAVPREALIRTGTQDSVILALGAGRFRPAVVRVGAENEGYVEILDGLREGEHIVSSGQFLLDAEANFQGAAARMEGGDASQKH